MIWWLLGIYLAGALVVAVGCVLIVVRDPDPPGWIATMSRARLVRHVVEIGVAWPLVVCVAGCVAAGKVVSPTPVGRAIVGAGTPLGHRGVPVVATLCVVVGVGNVAIPVDYVWSWWSWTFAAVVNVLAFWTLSQLDAHGNRMCADCAAAIPNRPQDELDRRRRQLRWFHLLQDHLLLSLIVPTAIIGIQLLRMLGPIGWYASALVWTPLLVEAVIVRTHHRLRPWCPYCKGWGEGDGEHESTPTPDPTGAKVA